MTDIKSHEARSRNMAAIRSKDTAPEIYLRKGLFKRGYRYRIAPSYVIGHPDLYLAKYRVAVFVHGCFWHRHVGCRYSYVPKSRVEFWQKKFESNISRDKTVMEQLKKEKVRCLIVWECSIKQARKGIALSESLFEEVIKFLESGQNYMEISPN